MGKYNIYEINSFMNYTGISLVAAEDVDQANDFIHDFMESDPHNYRDSRGYSYVSEEDRLEYLYSDTAGIIYEGIYYRIVRKAHSFRCGMDSTFIL